MRPGPPTRPRPRTRRRLHLLAVAAVVALAGAGLIAATSTPPTTTLANDLGGRAWIPVAGDGGDQLVLVNGISGLIEAQADQPPPRSGLAPIAADGGHTLLEADGDLVVVDHASHRARTMPTLGGSSVLVADEILTVGPRGPVLRAASGGEEARPLPLSATTLPTPPVVDRTGTAWFLAERAGTRLAVRHRAGGTLQEQRVGAGTDGLQVVDGHAYARAGNRLTALDGGRDLPELAGGEVLPTLAVETGGRWAVADGRELILVGSGAEQRLDLGAPIRGLALWQGEVWAFTDQHVTTVSEQGEQRRIPGLAGPVEPFVSGGLLWLRSGTTVVAAWPDRSLVTFNLAAVRVDLCQRTCDPAQIDRYLEEQAETEAQAEPQRPRDIEPPTASPTIPATTAVPATSEPPPTRPSATTSPTAATTTTSTPGGAGAVPGTSPSATTTATTDPTTTTTEPDDGTTTAAPQPTDPPNTTPSTPPTEPPGGSVDLIFAATLAGSALTASLTLEGSPAACPGYQLLGTTAEISTSGAFEARRSFAVPWLGGTSPRQTVEFPVPDAASGPVTVTVRVCGRQATQQVVIPPPAAEPAVSTLRVTPEAPVEGQAYTATVEVTLPAGWQMTSSTWAAGPCGSETSVGGTEARASQEFTAVAGPNCVTVVLTFTDPAGSSPTRDRSTSFDAQTTTTVAPTTTEPSDDPTTTTTAGAPPP